LGSRVNFLPPLANLPPESLTPVAILLLLMLLILCFIPLLSLLFETFLPGAVLIKISFIYYNKQAEMRGGNRFFTILVWRFCLPGNKKGSFLHPA
jgi:hypothetical protein